MHLSPVLAFCDKKCTPQMMSILKLSHSISMREIITILRKNRVVKELESRLKMLAIRMLGDMVMQYHLDRAWHDELDDSISLAVFLDRHHLHFLFW